MILLYLHKIGLPFLFILLVFGIVGLPIPDELLILTTGMLVAKGEFSIVATLITTIVGACTGVTFSFLIGRFAGPKLVKKFGAKVNITEDKILLAKKWFLRVGKWLLIIGYFIPLFRHLIGIIAGGSKLDYKVFALYAYTGAIVWSLMFLSIGYYLGLLGKQL